MESIDKPPSGNSAFMIEESDDESARIRRLIDSPGYRQADEDRAFLQQP